MDTLRIAKAGWLSASDRGPLDLWPGTRMHHSSHWFVHAHDLRLVVVAAFVCSLAAFTVFTILERARHAFRPSIGWIAMAGLVCGVGTWATHFIAMLSY